MTTSAARVRVAALVAFGAIGLAIAVAAGVLGANERKIVEIGIHYSHFTPSTVTVKVGQPVTFVIRNTDPIDHEWIVGDEALHQRHRTGTEPHHGDRPTEVSVDAGTTVETTVTFGQPGTLTFICHLPGHEAYGMVGTLIVTGG